MAGIKGRSGRKSKYQELANAERLHAMFLEKLDQEEIENRIRSGKFSIEDRVKLTAMEGDTTVLTRLLSKVYPDNVDLTSKGDKIQTPIYGGHSVQGHDGDPSNLPTEKED